MRIFGFLLIFLTKINTNSAKSCLLFRRKGIGWPRSSVPGYSVWKHGVLIFVSFLRAGVIVAANFSEKCFLEFCFFALKTDFFEVKKDNKKMKIPLSIIFEKNAKHEKIILMRILIFLIFFQTK